MTRYVLPLVLAAMVALSGCGGGTWQPDQGEVRNVTVSEPKRTVTATPGSATPTTNRTPTGTATPTATPTPAPGESYEFGGVGSTTTDPFGVRGGLVVVNLSSGFDGEFAAWIVGDDGRRRLVDADGDRWDGRVALLLPRGEYRLRIETRVPWKATVRQPTFPRDRAQSPPVRVRGEDADYVPVVLNGSTTVELRGEDETQYALRLIDDDGRSTRLASGSGSGKWERTVDGDGLALVQVRTDGEWELRVESE